jgi:CDP-paratose 2-epimerase
LSLWEATQLCEEITGHTIPLASVREARPADVRIYLSDHRLLSSVNGWSPQRDAQRTFTDILHWLREEEMQLRPLFVSP